MGQKRSTEEIARLLEGYEASGLTRTEYCRREGIGATTLDYYRRRKAHKEKGRLVKVVVQSDPAEPKSVFTVLLANGRRIESGWKYGEAELARLIRICEAA
jgi:hypothetical protein